MSSSTSSSGGSTPKVNSHGSLTPTVPFTFYSKIRLAASTALSGPFFTAFITLPVTIPSAESQPCITMVRTLMLRLLYATTYTAY